VSTSLVLGGENTGGLYDVVSTSLAPGNGRWVLLAEDLNLVAIDNELSVCVVNISAEDAVYGVVLVHVDHVLEINERVIDGDDLDVLVQDSVPEYDTANSTETVDSYGD